MFTRPAGFKKRFGLTPWKERSAKQKRQHERFCSDCPKFFIANQTEAANGREAFLWQAAKKVTGAHIPTLYQQTGSCVGNGAWNAIQYLQTCEQLAGDLESFQWCFWPYHYGRGRLASGIGGSGDGSTGSGQAEAIIKEGVIYHIEDDSLPKSSGEPDQLTYGASVEMKWSNGRNIAQKYLDIGKQHLVKTAALITNNQQAMDALYNGYPITIASMVGFESPTEIYNGRAWKRARGSWAHQMSVIGFTDDPKRPGIYIMNSWSAGWQPQVPDGAPPGGYWATFDDMDRIWREQESFAFSGHMGYPERLVWSLV